MRLFAVLLLALGFQARAIDIESVRPDANYDPAVPTPESFFGFEPGEWHLRHDQLVAYMQQLAAVSPRVSAEIIGRTHEFRPQLLVAITHPDNQGRLEALREAHLDYIHGRSNEPGPLIVWLGYSIHGNEASGSNAAPLVAYHLAASQQAEEWLRNTIVLIDPSLNPDGMGRFATWVNSHRSRSPNADPADREHQEHWPGGRFNHYWFDLNRDWLLLTHPESRHRVRVFQDWRPHVFADYHEMGSDSTYFFQPGVPDRTNPLTPAVNAELTTRLAQYHAEAFDEVGQLYFSEEVFDDYYYGKGSTYPDVQGSVGILFEQASVRGHLRETAGGVLPFATAVRNHVLTSLSTIQGARDLATELKTAQREFVSAATERAAEAGFDAYIFGSAQAPYRTDAMAERLAAHAIELFELAQDVTIDDTTFGAGDAYVVPLRQSQYSLIEALFETRTEFKDTTFYDVSTWTFPQAFNVPAAQLRRLGDLQGAAFQPGPDPAPEPDAGAYAYLIGWDHYLAPRALARLMAEDLPVRVATEPFAIRTGDAERELSRGTLLVPRGLARDRGEVLDRVLAETAGEDGIEVIGVGTGLTPTGVDLGSASFRPLEPVKPVLVTGPGVDPSEAGEVWHLLDVRFRLPPTMVDTTQLADLNLSRYTHVLMVDGDYSRLGPDWVQRLHQWIKAGGVLVTTKGATAWATEQSLPLAELPAPDAIAEEEEEEEEEPLAFRAYGDYEDDFSRTVIGGAIVRAAVDVSHPVAYGYHQPELALFRNGTVFLERAENPYETPLRYLDQPLVSGYLGVERAEQLGGSAAVLATKVGQGAVIRFADNPNFRGFWYGTNRLYLNALFLGQILTETPVPDLETRL